MCRRSHRATHITEASRHPKLTPLRPHCLLGDYRRDSGATHPGAPPRGVPCVLPFSEALLTTRARDPLRPPGGYPSSFHSSPRAPGSQVPSACLPRVDPKRGTSGLSVTGFVCWFVSCRLLGRVGLCSSDGGGRLWSGHQTVGSGAREGAPRRRGSQAAAAEVTEPTVLAQHPGQRS